MFALGLVAAAFCFFSPSFASDRGKGVQAPRITAKQHAELLRMYQEPLIKEFRTKPTACLKHLLDAKDGDCEIRCLMAGVLCETLGAEFEEKFLDYQVSEDNRNTDILVVKSILKKMKSVDGYFAKCSHRLEDEIVTQAFLEELLGRDVENDTTILLTSLIRKGTAAPTAVFGEYAEVDKVATKDIREALSYMINSRTSKDQIFKLALGLMNNKDPLVTKSRYEYVSGMATLNSTEFTENQMRANVLLFKVLPSTLSSAHFNDFTQRTKGKIFLRLYLLKFYDPLNLISQEAEESERKEVMRILKRINETYNANIMDIITAIRACRPSLIDEESVLMKQLEGRNAERLQKQVEEKIIQAPETTKPSVLKDSEDKESPTKPIPQMFVKIYMNHADKLRYFRPEFLTATNITETMRNCLLAFEFSFESSAIRLLRSDMDMSAKLAFLDLLFEFAQDPRDLTSKLLTIQAASQL